MVKIRCSRRMPWLALGVGIGNALGVAFDNLAMGIALGVALGAALQGWNPPRD